MAGAGTKLVLGGDIIFHVVEGAAEGVSRHGFGVTTRGRLGDQNRCHDTLFGFATWVAVWAVATWFWRRNRKPHCGLKWGRDIGIDVTRGSGF